MRRPFFVHPLLPFDVPLRHACVLLAACLVGSMACAAQTPTSSLATQINNPDAANQWPRLFYSSAQRAAMVRARQAKETIPAPEPSGDSLELPPPLPTFVLQGMARGRQGASVWINGQMLRNGAVLGERTVYIEQHAVRLRQPGQPDVVLKPGQTSLEPGQPVVDVVPAGAFLKR